MPRKDFQRDLKEATCPDQFPFLKYVRAGDHDGSISFTFCALDTPIRIEFQAIVSDLHDYPRNHDYFVFSTSDNAPSNVTKVLDEARTLFAGLSIEEMLSTISQLVDNALFGRNPETTEELEEEDNISASEDDAVFEDDGMDWDPNGDDDFFIAAKAEPELRSLLRRDLRAAKHAGFKVGYLGAVTGSIIVSVSCRIARLGLSEEAMQAWNVRPSEYLVLLIRYPSTYLDLKTIIQEIGDSKNAFIQLHVGLCDSYKPSLEQALQVFQGSATLENEKDSSTPTKDNADRGISCLFIGKPLNTLLNERFLPIASHRLKYGFSWTGAELYFHRNQGKAFGAKDDSEEYFEQDSWSSSAPEFLTADHMADAGCDLSRVSLPLLAMQFTLRHFVKCTEFCLVCHCRTGDSFEALKPYVCSNGLCLYQYIALGMGPSLEYEIRTQPYVVDMLISLAYARASSGKLDDFPTGLGLKIPAAIECLQSYKSHGNTANNRELNTHYYEAELNPSKMELVLDYETHLRVGDWIAILEPEKSQPRDVWHCRVQEIELSKRYVHLSTPVSQQAQVLTRIISSSKMLSVRYTVYETNFDDLDPGQKRETLLMLLDTLPDIDTMTKFLGHDSNDKSLSTWKDRPSPAALDVLRWIVASNRSCIMQDNDDADNRVSGMESYIQFRFAQGAPDKEQRFLNAVKSTAISQPPTIFAWHGSSLCNWHSILREGLWFKEIVNGRAYGNGVYMSNNFTVSLGYATNYHNNNHGNIWSRSKLKFRVAVSLNEVVNAPQQFISRQPHYVVEQLDWIQPRYLFVQKSVSSTENVIGSVPTTVYPQDPQYTAVGPRGNPVSIPISALSSQRRQDLGISLKKETKGETAKRQRSSSHKRKRGSKGPISPPLTQNDIDDDDTMSVATAFDDLHILLSDSEDDGPAKAKVKCDNGLKSTDFKPGTLKEETLSLLAPPEYASTPATKILQQHLKATLKIQQKEPLHELGWYVDPALMSTVYQWIVELHTFDNNLPLAKDLKAANMTSVVLELRFPPSFPMAPPFVRVIRPRFLEFAAGGGGHVTLGGAMCMELLTGSGWLPTASIESVLLQVRMAISSTEPRPARLALGRLYDYKVGEAIEAYKRACMAHGWQIPQDIQRLSWT